MRKQKHAGKTFVRIACGSAVVTLMTGAALFLTPGTWGASAGYIRIIGAQGTLDGASKDPGHMNWVTVSSVVAADLNGDAQADRESSAPSVSELTASKAAIGSQSSGSGAGKATAMPRDAMSGMASGKRMHKPFTIRKEIDKASPLLMEACASGKHLNEVDVDLGSGGQYKLTDVMVSSDTKSSGGDRPMETISFTYQKIEMTR